MRRIYGDGPAPCRLMIVGERPGVHEHEAGRPFVGDAGEELWKRVWKILRLQRADFYVTNLVKTFSIDPPSDAEVTRDEGILRGELLKVRPSIIITIGYHAARWFLPQFRGVNGDYFHGLAFPYRYGRLTPRDATVVPVVHSAAALRQPDLYQNQLSDDLAAVKRVLAGAQSHHQSRRVRVYQVGLAAFGKEGQTVGCDTEGSKTAPECVTAAINRKEAACIEVFDKAPSKFLRASLTHAKRVIVHYALHDVPVLAALGIDDLPRVDDTMLMAYLLELDQGLKLLAFRELGWRMDEYADLVDPLDEDLCRRTLQANVDEWSAEHDRLMAKATRIETKRAAGKRVTKKAIKARYGRLLRRSDVPLLRVVKGVQRMIERTEIDGTSLPRDGM